MTGDPQIGQTLGAYRIRRLLKRTGVSMVYLARDDKLERDVVVKVMLPSHNADEAFAARFQQEALATARLSHPNIIHIYDFGHQTDLYYMSRNTCPAARFTIG